MEKEDLVKQIMYVCDMPVSYDTKKAIIEEFLDNFEKEVSAKTDMTDDQFLKILEKTNNGKKKARSRKIRFKHWKRSEVRKLRSLVRKGYSVKYIAKQFPQYDRARVENKIYHK